MTLTAGPWRAQVDGRLWRTGCQQQHPDATVGGVPLLHVVWNPWRWELTRRRATRAAVRAVVLLAGSPRP